MNSDMFACSLTKLLRVRSQFFAAAVGIFCTACACNHFEVNHVVLFPQSSDGNFTLYVGNESFVISPVDITIYINGQKAVSADFCVKDQHKWKAYSFELPPGTHHLKVVSRKGGATLEEEFNVEGKHWAVVYYWYSRKSPDERIQKQFCFSISDKPVHFY